MPPSLADYARSLQDSWQRSDGDRDPTVTARPGRVICRLWGGCIGQNHSDEVTATALKVNPVEVRRIVWGLSRPHTRLVEPQD